MSTDGSLYYLILNTVNINADSYFVIYLKFINTENTCCKNKYNFHQNVTPSLN